MVPAMESSTRLLELLRIDAPIIQAPMAGVSTPELAAVSNRARSDRSASAPARRPTHRG
jgi:hypothetical protein